MIISFELCEKKIWLIKRERDILLLNYVTFSLNGIAFSYQPDVIIGPLAQYDSFCDSTVEGTCPQLQPQSLVLPSNSAFATPYTQLYNTTSEYSRPNNMKFPENCPSNNVFNYGGSILQPVFGPPSNGLQVNYWCAEPVIVPPFVHDNHSLVPGLYGVNQFTLTYNIIPSRFWHSNMVNRTDVGLNVFRDMQPLNSTLFKPNPILTMIYITPAPTMV
jgi:hypothetical protein